MPILTSAVMDKQKITKVVAIDDGPDQQQNRGVLYASRGERKQDPFRLERPCHHRH